MSFDATDAFTGGTSDCCGAPIMLGGMCSDCKEHCNEQEDDEEEEEHAPTTKTLIKIRPASCGDIWTIEKDEGRGAGWEQVLMSNTPGKKAPGYLNLKTASADVESIASQLRAHQIEVEILPARV